MHADNLDKLVPVFEALCQSLSDQQKKAADKIFGPWFAVGVASCFGRTEPDGRVVLKKKIHAMPRVRGLLKGEKEVNYKKVAIWIATRRLLLVAAGPR